MSSLSSTDASASPSSSDQRETTLLLIDPSDERTVEQHPDVVPWLKKGWQIRRTEPRIVEDDGTTQLLVVLARSPADSPSSPFTAKIRE